jgi:hypothetical protein
MKTTLKDDILSQLALKQGRGEHVDRRLFTSIRDSEALYLFTIFDEDSFLSLIWQEIDATRLLTPGGQPRTMKEVGSRLQIWQGFSRLAGELDLPRTQHNPAWFERCVQIDTSFDYNRFGWISVVHPNDSERRQSPRGSFYIYDGVHRALVLAKRLLSQETEFQSIAAFLLSQGRHSGSAAVN